MIYLIPPKQADATWNGAPLEDEATTREPSCRSPYIGSRREWWHEWATWGDRYAMCRRCGVKRVAEGAAN